MEASSSEPPSFRPAGHAQVQRWPADLEYIAALHGLACGAFTMVDIAVCNDIDRFPFHSSCGTRCTQIIII